MTRKIAVLALAFALSLWTPPYSQATQETTPLPPEDGVQRVGAQKVPDPDGVKIYEQYKDCIVDVQVTVTIEDGQVFSFGGSGALYHEDGTILTAAHVVKEENDQVRAGFFGERILKIVSYEYWVEFKNKNRKYKAELLGANIYNDTAFLKMQDFDPAGYAVAKLGNSDSVRVGERVYALGSPFGLSLSLTSGTVSALHRYINGLDAYLQDYIQSDTSINLGNSGGPMINSQGEVIGINVRAAQAGGDLMLAVPINMVEVEQLKKGSAEIPWFGLEALVENFRRAGTEQMPMIEDLTALNKLTGIRDIDHLKTLAKLTYKDRWAVVHLIDETKSPDGKHSPAKRAGLKKGDIITKINGKPISGGMEIRRMVVGNPLDKEMEVEYIRIDKSGVPQTAIVKLKPEKKPLPKMDSGHNH